MWTTGADRIASGHVYEKPKGGAAAAFDPPEETDEYRDCPWCPDVPHGPEGAPGGSGNHVPEDHPMSAARDDRALRSVMLGLALVVMWLATVLTASGGCGSGR
ncbi:hypothetical protein GCM10010415_30790 [Streptomyces atrovirens]|uniref:Uncharacterized protein n=1 Tax=Streptomyces atrovirens TaxID=285556 RepID=A0ABW0DSZ2_9ACTN